MISWWRGIVFKRFIAQMTLLIAILLTIYGLLYVYLPIYNYDSQLKNSMVEIDAFEKELKKSDAENTKQFLYSYYAETNIKFTIYDLNNSIVFPILELNDTSGYLKNSSIKNLDKPYIFENLIVFNGQNYKIIYRIPIQSKLETRNILGKFLVYITLFSLLISLIASFLFAKSVTRPIVTIYKGATKFEQLDFSNKITIASKDELGQLANNLNSMSQNLQNVLTELKLANKKLASDAKRIELEEAKRKNLIIAISHELKTPVASVMGQIEAMIENIGPFQDRDFYLKKSYMIMEDMQVMIDEMLDVTKMDHIKISDLTMSMINLSSLTHSIVARQKKYFSDDIQVEISIEDNLYTLTEQTMITKALDNIIKNAFKYCDSNKKVKLTLKKKDDRIHLYVYNTAQPLTNKQLKHVFDPLYRVDTSRQKFSGGSGMGLYIVEINFKKLNIHYGIKNHKKGVLFEVEIPLL